MPLPDEISDGPEKAAAAASALSGNPAAAAASEVSEAPADARSVDAAAGSSESDSSSTRCMSDSESRAPLGTPGSESLGASGSESSVGESEVRIFFLPIGMLL